MAWQALFDFEEKKRKVILRMVCWLLKSPNLPNGENTVKKKSQRIEPQFPARKDYY